MKQKAEQIRKKYLYRRLLVKGRVRLPHRSAARLIGPDCAYHLYATYDPEDERETAVEPGREPVAGRRGSGEPHRTE